MRENISKTTEDDARSLIYWKRPSWRRVS